MSSVMHNSHNQQQVDTAEVTGVILAGGRSTRMGRDKATLRIAGQTLFERARDMLDSIFPHLLIAGDRPDLATDRCPCFADIYPGSALGGIHAGLVAAPTPWIFVVPCDLAYPDADLVRYLLRQRNACDAVVPRTPGGFEPVFALYHKTCLAPMERLLNSGNYRIYDFYNQVRVRYVEAQQFPSDWQRALFNLNSPDDLNNLAKEDA